MQRNAVLYVFSGLPGSGKTELSKRLAREVGAAYVRIDTVEQALKDLCAIDVQAEGYGLAYRIVAENLRLGTSVVADCCNPIALTRHTWQQVARDALAHHVDIEVICSDAREHRTRLQNRTSDIPGLKCPTWPDVENREYEAWRTERIVIDTSGKSPAQCSDELIAELSRRAAMIPDPAKGT